MRNVNIKQAMLIAVAGMAIAIASGSANAAKGGREAALDKCFAQARASGEIVPGGAGGENRAAVYKDCMRKAGYRP
jgi:hypothetical protein